MRGKKPKAVLSLNDVRTILGPPKFESATRDRANMPGVVTGLAFTPVGGEILFIEATHMPGKGNLTVTGQLGEVMKESAQAAHSIVRSRADELHIDAKLLSERDIHIHVPAGAIPKDGPSAGVAMLTALVSLLTHRKVDGATGMTGEITLRGRVLPIGGLKEKVLAAHRAGLKRVILPERNMQDLEEIPEEVRDDMNFVPVRTIDELLKAVFDGAANNHHSKKRRAKSNSR